MQPLVLCADVGGTQIKTGLLDASGRPASPIRRADARAALPRQQLLDHMAACLLAAAQDAPPGSVQGVRLAMPGPFDYAAGICRIEGLGKYGALYNADLRAELGSRLAPALGAAAADIRFQNDVAAFALGELRFGCARGTGRGLFVCIGTGCGSAFSLGDSPAPEGTPGMPAGGYLYPLPLAQRARAGDAGALAVWQQFGALLAEALTPALDAYRPQLCCLGGQVTASGTLFLEPLHRACRQRGVRLETTADTSLRAMQGALVT